MIKIELKAILTFPDDDELNGDMLSQIGNALNETDILMEHGMLTEKKDKKHEVS